jgi:CubicO group peptidase (beta-lactamase class C family)
MRKFLKITGIVIGVILLLCLIGGGYLYYKLKNIKDSHDLQAQVVRMSENYIKSGKSPGLFVGIIQGDTVFAQGFGVVNKESKLQPDSNTVFEVGSVSKVFTAEIAQLLVAQHVISWDDLLTKYLPDSAKPTTEDGTTLRHLTSHTSGFPRLPQMWFSKLEQNPCDPYSPLTMEDVYTYLRHDTDKKKPGKDAYEYSNMGAGLLGHVLVWKTGQSYETLLQQFICSPLQMSHTTIMLSDTTSLATGYDETGKPTCHWHFPVLPGAGAVTSTGADMLTFLRANLQNSSPISEEIRKTQQEVASIPGGGVGYGWHIDRMSGMVFGIDEIVWHNGNTGGFSSYIGFIPGTRRGIVLLSNQGGEDLDRLALSMMMRLGHISLK